MRRNVYRPIPCAHPCAARAPAFTLVELIAVIIVLAVLAGVAIPKYFDYSERARVAALSSSLKVVRNAIIQYRINNGGLPPDGVTGSDIPEIAPYLQDPRWANPIGEFARFNWDGPPGHVGTEAIALVPNTTPTNPNTDAFWTQIDRALDDGDLTTGVFGWSSSNRYKFWIDPPQSR